MKQLKCPLNGWRSIAEFTYGGEFQAMPHPQESDAKAWAEYVFFDRNPAGVVIEWWCHTASSYWFLAERHTVTDEIQRTMECDKYLKELNAEAFAHPGYRINEPES